jgi:hypothetical protein
MNIKELKAKDAIKCTRVNKNFTSNTEILNNSKAALIKAGWNIEGVTHYSGELTFHVSRAENQEHTYFTNSRLYSRAENIEKARRRLTLEGFNIISEKSDKDYTVFTTDTRREKIRVKLNPPEIDLEKIEGFLKIRSKDMEFIFRNSRAEIQRIYAPALKKDMIDGNIIHIINPQNGVNIEYHVEL